MGHRFGAFGAAREPAETLHKPGVSQEPRHSRLNGWTTVNPLD
jgi:hypothetical protein